MPYLGRMLAVGLAIAMTLAACEGPEGPMGPEGLPGPEGPQGPAGQDAVFEVLVEVATVGVDGSATTRFPGVQVRSAVVSCWLSQDGVSTWLKLGTDLSGPTCGAADADGDMLVIVIEAPAGWRFMATAVVGE